MIHDLRDCQKIKDIPEKVAHELGIVHILQIPLTSQQLILHDNFCDAQTLVNANWILTLLYMACREVGITWGGT